MQRTMFISTISSIVFWTTWFCSHRLIEKTDGKNRVKPFSSTLMTFYFSIILQMSVWQDYLLSLAYVYPSNEQQTEITDRVFELLKVLLHHAVKFEFGGWRVWIDTLSILHGRVNLPWDALQFQSWRVECLGNEGRLLSSNRENGGKHERQWWIRGSSFEFIQLFIWRGYLFYYRKHLPQAARTHQSMVNLSPHRPVSVTFDPKEIFIFRHF